MLDELEERRAELIKKAEEYKRRRSELNSEASKWSELRDELNGRIREVINKAKEFKDQREEYKKKSSEKKSKRDELNRKASLYYSRLEKSQKKNNIASIQTLENLRERIDDLEFKQQVKVLSMDKERQLVAKITELKKEFNGMQKELEGDKRLRELLIKVQGYRREADEYHKELIKHEKLAQECHEKMVKSFKEADRLREKADESHRLFLKAQEAADEAHGLFIKDLRDIRDFDRVINGVKRKIGEDWEFRGKIEARKKAKDVYERFREGEKLNTTDLLVLQKSEML
jgi:uncharacterized coiled-coil DUF342 family protein